MNKQEIYGYLNDKNISYEVTEHQAVFNMEQLSEIELPHPDADAKNLFVRDNKKKNYYLITVKGDKRVDLKDFRRRYGTRPLTFASGDDLMSILGLISGAVTPLGVLNDAEAKVKVFIDGDFTEGDGIIGVHPNDNTATVWLGVCDLIDIIKAHGNDVETVQV